MDEREPTQAILKLSLKVPGEPVILWRVPHHSTIQVQCCLTSVFEWELVYPTRQLCWRSFILNVLDRIVLVILLFGYLLQLLITS